ncbi:lethal(3)malignant brain tumor-like protein 3 [Acipenser oxyrinchus oxyrinchus]|uniref:Lethal(3)malignant brain tumor-like protein 3 n=1 Tax=Acipenser oxyrinchus oxyrinchus TaxID=40147 RepID=A0AAD8LSV7_ACIOX|nr:lethal(3)malignant brain tumor-like protein 3 [Acipenser oxyrinchus oxyrinchus]
MRMHDIPVRSCCQKIEGLAGCLWARGYCGAIETKGAPEGRRNKAEEMSSPHVNGKKKTWCWDRYLEEQKAIAAPVKLFTEHQTFPANKNGFKVGMRLEGIDPLHPSMLCVLSVAEVLGYRIRLHFDGFSECYDFWANADSPDIHAVGWCTMTGHKLQPPKAYMEDGFDWESYLTACNVQAAPKNLFKNQNATVTPSGFQVGMKLEAVDRKNPSLVCVASIADIVGNRFLVHFDNWDDTYDYWCNASSPHIHPVGWCQDNGRPLTAPQGCPNPESFSWEEYLEETGTSAVPGHAFKVVHFDGWSRKFDFWIDSDTPDIHPVGWCRRTGHPLELPLRPADLKTTSSQGVCPTPGCRGVGHIKGARHIGHHSAFGCPYSEINMKKEMILPDRLGGEKQITFVPVHLAPKTKRLYSPDADEKPEEYNMYSRSPVSGYDGPGRLRGRYAAHQRLSGYPLAEKQNLKVKTEHNSDHQAQGNKVFTPAVKKSKLQSRLAQSATYLKIKEEKEDDDEEEDEIDLHSLFRDYSVDNMQQALHQSVFLSAMSAQPNRDLPLCWEQHCKLLPGVAGVQASRVAHWTADEVASFVHSLPGCEEQAKQFKEEQIDGKAFLLLSQVDIVKIMSVKLGPALKIYNSILMFKNAEDMSKDTESGNIELDT